MPNSVMYHGIVIALILSILVKSGHAVKCYECSAVFDSRNSPSTGPPVGGCWDEGMDPRRIPVVDCPIACVTYRLFWPVRDTKEVPPHPVEIDVSTYTIRFSGPNPNPIAVAIRRECGQVRPDADVNHCGFSAWPGQPDGDLFELFHTPLTSCCATDFCNGYTGTARHRVQEAARWTASTTTTNSPAGLPRILAMIVDA